MTAPEFPEALVTYLAAINAVNLLMSLVDKWAAMHLWWRIPERLLLALAVLGGAPGAKIAQAVSGHKSLRPDFAIHLVLIVVFHLALLGQHVPLGVPRLALLNCRTFVKRHPCRRPGQMMDRRRCRNGSGREVNGWTCGQHGNSITQRRKGSCGI